MKIFRSNKKNSKNHNSINHGKNNHSSNNIKQFGNTKRPAGMKLDNYNYGSQNRTPGNREHVNKLHSGTNHGSQPQNKQAYHNQIKHHNNIKPNKKLFTKYMQEKLAITVLVITLALFALVYVLYQIIKDNKDNYNQIVLTQHSSYDSRVIPYRRGDILDRNGTYLATSERVYNLIIDPKQIMTDPDKYLESTVSALVSVFGYDRNEIITLIQENKETAYVRHERQLPYEKKDEFEALELQTNKDNSDNKVAQRIKGVWFEDEYKRVYPYSSLACNLIGFASGDSTEGSGGIEQFYNNVLVGNNGREYGYLNDDSNLEAVIKAPTNGNTVISTIDRNIQNVVEKRIQEWQTETGSDRIGVIAMNPNNGEILAMATDKLFDLNNPRDLTGVLDTQLVELGEKEAVDEYKRKNKVTITKEQIYEHYSREEVLALGKQVEWNQRWRNFCISDTYEPGSPSKIFTIAAAMEEGVITGNETYVCDGYQEVGGWRIRCVNRNGHGVLTVPETLMVSCNDAMMQIAAQTGKERFYKYQDIFGFGYKTGIDLPGEADANTLVHTAENSVSSDLATNSFGQTYNCTMIQMSAAYCSVINGGSYYEPHVIKQIVNEHGSVVKKVEPTLVRETVSQSTSNFINNALFRTVNDTKGKVRGTGSAAAVEGYDIAGKTGTAEKIPRDTGNYLVSFAGYAPAENPEVFVYVIIDQPHVKDQPHSSYASGVFAKIMQDILPYLNVFPNTELPENTEDPENQLPIKEGITSNPGTATEGETEESTEALPETQPQPFPDEEYVPPIEGGSGIPSGLLGEPQPDPESSGADFETRESSSRAETSSAPETSAAP